MPVKDGDAPRRFRPFAASRAGAIAVSVVVLGLAGCSLTAGARDGSSAKVDEVLRSGQGEFDLTSPPSREEAGMPAGELQVTYEGRSAAPFDVRVALPDGEQLAVAARSMTFDSLGSKDPASAPPTALFIAHSAASLDEGRDHLLAVAGQFDLDVAAIDGWHREAMNPSPVGPPTTRSPWLGATLGYLHLSVRGLYSQPIDNRNPDRAAVHYLLSWDEGSTTQPGG